MARIKDYKTTRNKEKIVKISQKVECKLTAGEIYKLTAKYAKYNEWQKSFYNSLKDRGYKIVSSKQYEVIKVMLSK